MRHRAALISIPVLAALLAACEREKKPDPFYVSGAMRLESEFLTLSAAEERLKTIPEGRALPQVEDPCGDAPGPEKASQAWVRAELVRLGHDPKMFCDILQNPTAPRPEPEKTPETLEEMRPRIAAMQARTAMMRDNLNLKYQAEAEAIRILNAAPRGGRPDTSTPP